MNFQQFFNKQLSEQGTRQRSEFKKEKSKLKKQAYKELYRHLSNGEFEYTDRRDLIKKFQKATDEKEKQRLANRIKEFLQVQAREKANFKWQFPPGKFIRKQNPGVPGEIFRKLLDQIKSQMRRRASHNA